MVTPAVARRVARAAIRDLIALTESGAQRATISAWLNGEEPHMLRGLWVCEEIFEQAALSGLDGRSLVTSALYVLLHLERTRQLKLLALSRESSLSLTRSSLLAALMPSARSKRSGGDQIGGDAEHLSTADGRALTLGERRALARRPSAKSIERLSSDPDPVVVKHLLQNPRLTEPLALRLVTRRPQRPVILLMVFEHPVWGIREQVRRALALNPSTPLAVRCLLLSHLSADDLDSARREPKHPAVFYAAVRRAESRLSQADEG